LKKSWGCGRRRIGHARDEGASLREDAIEEHAVFGGVRPVEAPAGDDDGEAPGFQRRLVCRRVDAGGAAGPHGEAFAHEGGGDRPGEGERFVGGAPGSHDGDARERWEAAAHVEDGRIEGGEESGGVRGVHRGEDEGG
jgi:hypothetical protein